MAEEKDLIDLLDAVRDRESFLTFVAALAADRRAEAAEVKVTPSSPFGPGRRGWENTALEQFLEQAGQWAHDVIDTNDERAAWFPAQPSWSAFARFLYAGKIYE